MGEYDSDESLSDAEFSSSGDYIQTNVLLGYASQKARKPKDDQFSQLGGHPTWLDDKTAPSGALAKCKSCNEYMSLFLQIYANIPDKFPGHERALYVFGCRRKACRRKEGSIRGIRAVRAEKTQTSQSVKDSTKIMAPTSSSETSPRPQPRNIGSSLFGVAAPSNSGLASLNPFSTGSAAGGNPFSSPSSKSTTSNPFASASSIQSHSEPSVPVINEPPSSTTLAQSFAEKVKINSDNATPTPAVPRPHEPWPEVSKFPAPYPKYFIDVEWEGLDNPNQPEALPAGVRLDTEMMEEDTGSGRAGLSGDTKTLFESSMDKAFQKYADRVAQNYEQVLRYEHGGLPLLYSTTDAVGKLLSPHSTVSNSGKVTTSSTGPKGMSRCGNCGAKRTFELQMTSNAIVELEAEEDAFEGMDWGTILVGVCERDCLPQGVGEREVGYLEEWVGVQWEELSEKRR